MGLRKGLAGAKESEQYLVKTHETFLARFKGGTPYIIVSKNGLKHTSQDLEGIKGNIIEPTC